MVTFLSGGGKGLPLYPLPPSQVERGSWVLAEGPATPTGAGGRCRASGEPTAPSDTLLPPPRLCPGVQDQPHTCPDAHWLLRSAPTPALPTPSPVASGTYIRHRPDPLGLVWVPLKAEPEIRMWGSRWFVSEVVPGRPSEGGVPWGRGEEPQPEPSFPGDPRGGGRRAHAPLAPLPKAVQAGAGVFIADPDFAGGEGVPNGGASRQPCSHSEPEKPRLGRGAEREGPRRCVGGGGRPPMVPPSSGRARSGLCPLPRPTPGCRHPPHTSSLFQNLLCQL